MDAPLTTPEARNGRRSKGRRPPAVVWIPALAVAAAVALPLLYLILRASEAGQEEFLETLLDTDTFAVLVRSVLLAGLVAGASIMLAVPLSWLTARTDLPGRKVWTVLAALPLVIPSYVGGFVLVSSLGPRGMLQGFLEPLG
ncbi:MAG: iron ABC transporter permease, partial [Rubrobacter sp.]